MDSECKAVQNALYEKEEKQTSSENVSLLKKTPLFTMDTVGMSRARVFCFSDKVLKIEEYGEEPERERAVMEWLQGRLPVPEVLSAARQKTRMSDDGAEVTCQYLLMSRLPGEMSCAGSFLQKPHELVRLLAEGLKMLWSVDISDCPYDASLEQKLRQAEYYVEHGFCDTENVEPGTYGEHGFANPRALLTWLRENRPPEELVFSHGDYCLPNVFLDQKADGTGFVSGFLDLGRSGVADKYQDIALCYRSLCHNYDGTYGAPAAGQEIRELDSLQETKEVSGSGNNSEIEEGIGRLLFEKLGITPDWEKIRYYILLDELF